MNSMLKKEKTKLMDLKNANKIKTAQSIVFKEKYVRNDMLILNLQQQFSLSGPLTL